MNDYVEHELSRKIYDKMYVKNANQSPWLKYGGQEVFIDPAPVILIGKISITVIRLIKGCRESREEREAAVRTPTLDDDRVLKRVVRRKLGWFKNLRMGGKVVKALKEMGTELNNEELERAELFNEKGRMTIYEGEKYYEL